MNQYNFINTTGSLETDFHTSKYPEEMDYVVPHPPLSSIRREYEHHLASSRDYENYFISLLTTSIGLSLFYALGYFMNSHETYDLLLPGGLFCLFLSGCAKTVQSIHEKKSGELELILIEEAQQKCLQKRAEP